MRRVNTASVETVFTLQGGTLLVIGAGARWETVGQRPRIEAGDAESEIIRLREHVENLRSIVNAMRAKYGKDPIT